MIIRPFAVTDSDAVINLWQDCGLVKPQNNPQQDIDTKLQVNPELFLVGELGGEIIASVMGGYEGHRGWINYLAVAEAQRRKGFGHRMMTSIEQMLSELGCPKINLQMRKENEDAVHFYTALGYGEDEVISLGKRLKR